MTHTNSITFDLAWYTILSQYSATVRRTVCDAVLNFALTGEVPVLKGIAKVAFQFIAHEVSKQLGRVPANTIQMPVATADEMPEQDNDKKDAHTPQQPENLTEGEPMESIQQGTEEDTHPESPKENCVESETTQIQDAAIQRISPSSPPERKAYAVPASPGNKKQNCISRSRIQAGKITCTRKGSKILFRRR